jgi:hypothetical protein
VFNGLRNCPKRFEGAFNLFHHDPAAPLRRGHFVVGGADFNSIQLSNLAGGLSIEQGARTIIRSARLRPSRASRVTVCAGCTSGSRRLCDLRLKIGVRSKLTASPFRHAVGWKREERRPKTAKFPCFFPCYQGIVTGERFVEDCFIHHPVPKVSDLSDNRSKSARLRAICNCAWTRRAAPAAL